MKVLVNCALPFSLGDGGLPVQVQCTLDSLNAIGVEAEPLRWWDKQQKGDVIHYFGRMPVEQIDLAHDKKIKVVMAELMIAQGSRNWMQRRIRRGLRSIAVKCTPRGLASQFTWEAYRKADAYIALTPWEKYLMQYEYDADPARIYVVPNGVESPFFSSPKRARGQWLVCTARIVEDKRVLELAQAAVIAKVPVWVIGKARSDDDPYAKRFFALARENPDYVRYEGPVGDRDKLAEAYQTARGFALLSTMEARSLSAEEAAASECPLLLSDLPWARSVFERGAVFCPVANKRTTATHLRAFYDAAPSIPAPLRPANWIEVARQLSQVYELVLAS